jgi:hypothetical protein
LKPPVVPRPATRRREHGDEGFLDAAKGLVELARHGTAALVGMLALGKGLERDKDDARVGAVGEAVDGQAGEGDGVLHIGIVLDDLAHAADHVFRAVQRGAIGQLGKADQVLLVLGRHKAAGHQLEQTPGRAHQHGVDHQHQRLAADDALHAAAIGIGAAAEQGVEAAEEAAQHALHAACQRVLGRVVAAQQQRGQRRRQGQRVDGRDHRRDGDGHRELAVELAREAADEGQRHEHGHQHQGDGDDGPAHLLHGAVGGLARRQPGLDVALHVLHHHDGVVHHDADGQHQAEQAQRIDGKAQQVQHGEGAHHRHRHGQQRNDGGAPGLQEQDHHHHHQGHGFQQGLDHGLDGGPHELRGVVGDAELHAFGHVLLQLGHGGAHIGRDLQGVGARGLEHAHAHGGSLLSRERSE